ncbi:cytochrome P450 CYP82D47-like [Rutidosis leptorrhynchoides]|uniref:cytochrome P450 CYP82D47-like n=1 Tax=Rutidosis leptorrhynchoides TaxID=125765 RepID=UPI003A98DCB7
MDLFHFQDEKYSSTLFVLSLTIILSAIIYKITRKNTTSAPEASGAWPVIGHLNLFSGSSDLPHVALSSMADRYGPIFTVWLGIRRVLVVSNWEIAKEIFTTHDVAVSDRPKYLAAKILGLNYASFSFTPYGPYWREIRKIISLEVLSSSRLEKLKFVRVSELENSIKSLRNFWSEKRDEEKGKVMVDMQKWFGELNMNIILKIVTGKRLGEDEKEIKRRRELFREWFHYTGLFVVADAFPFLGWLDLGGHERTMKRIASELDSMVGTWLDEHRNERASDESTKEKDFIDVMISAVKGDNLVGYNKDTIIKATSMTLIAGGIDTMSVMLTWTLSLLLNNRSTLKLAIEELDMHVGKGKQVNESSINNLVYLKAIIKEALRLYPAGFLGGPRAFSENCVVAGYNVPKGTWLLINMWKLHRDPNIWSDPCEFKPERFLTPKHKDVDVIGADYELIPFGAGRRSCPGIALSLQMLPMVIATVLQNFELSTPNDEDIDMTASIGMTNAKATPLQVLIAPRFPERQIDV